MDNDATLPAARRSAAALLIRFLVALLLCCTFAATAAARIHKGENIINAILLRGNHHDFEENYHTSELNPK